MGRVSDSLKNTFKNILTASLKLIIYMCFESLCFCYRHLNEVIGERCILVYSAFLKYFPDKFPKCLRIVYPWDATKFTPKFAGIPSHVMLMADMEGLRCKFDALISNIKGNMEDFIDERGVGGS